MRRYIILFILIGFAVILYAIAQASVMLVPNPVYYEDETMGHTLIMSK